MVDQAQYNFPYSIGDLRPSLLLEISRLLNEVSDYSNVKVSNSYKILDRDYIKKVRTLISKTRIYISAVYSVTDNPKKRETLRKAKYELLRWELYFKKRKNKLFCFRTRFRKNNRNNKFSYWNLRFKNKPI